MAQGMILLTPLIESKHILRIMDMIMIHLHDKANDFVESL